MARENGKYLGLVILILAGGLLVFVLHAHLGMTSDNETGPVVRMPVDPTVLPPILTEEQPPEMAVEPDLDNESMASEAEEAGMADDAITNPELPAPVPESQMKPQATVQPDPKPATEPTGKGTVGSIALDADRDGFTLTVQADRPVGDTTYMNLHDPRRLVVDLRQPWTYTGPNVLRSRSPLVEYVVVGEHSDRLRLVVHFRTPPAGRLRPRMERTGNRLVVTVP